MTPTTEIQKNVGIKEQKKLSAIESLATRLSVSRDVLEKTLKATAFRECKTNEEFVAAVIVANTYRLNPILGEIFAFPSKRGGVVPIVSIDGWISLVNRQENYDGVVLIENRAEHKNNSKTNVESVTATFYLKGKAHPVIVTEYMDECYDASKTPWQRWPIRMLRHKAYIQGARVAYGFSGIYDEDEGQRIVEAQATEVAPEEMPRALPSPEEQKAEPASVEQIENLKKVAAQANLVALELLDFLVAQGVKDPDKMTAKEYKTCLQAVMAKLDDDSKQNSKQ